MIKITYKLILLLSLLAMTVTSFAASEAEYRESIESLDLACRRQPRISILHGVDALHAYRDE